MHTVEVSDNVNDIKEFEGVFQNSYRLSTVHIRSTRRATVARRAVF